MRQLWIASAPASATSSRSPPSPTLAAAALPAAIEKLTEDPEGWIGR
jgi:hypothetical protein